MPTPKFDPSCMIAGAEAMLWEPEDSPAYDEMRDLMRLNGAVGDLSDYHTFTDQLFAIVSEGLRTPLTRDEMFVYKTVGQINTLLRQRALRLNGAIRKRPTDRLTPLAQNLWRLSTEAGWSQQQLADAADLDKKTVQRHEGGRGCKPETLKRYADAFSKSLGRRITGEDLLR